MRHIKAKLHKSLFLVIIPFVWLIADYCVHEQIKKFIQPKLNEPVGRSMFAIGLSAGLLISLLFICALLIWLSERRQAESNDYVDQMSRKFFVPINAIIGLSSTIAQADVASPYFSQEIALIHQTSHRIKHMLTDIEDYNKLKRHKASLSMQTLNLHSLTDTTLSFIQSSYHVEGVSIVNSVEKDCYVYADPIKLQQIIGNIVTVFLNFTARGVISVSARRRKTHMEIVIFDDGVGIEESFKSVAFEPIEGANSISTAHYSGTGLSLAIAKELVLLHHGKIWINQSLTSTSEIHFTLLKDSMVPHLSYKSYENHYCFRDIGDRHTHLLHDSNKAIGKVLLIKDGSIHKSTMAFYLYEAGYNVYLSQDSVSTLQQPDIDKRYDLVVLDETFRHSNFELCRILRENYTISQLPIILVVLNDRQINLSKAFSVGANDCIDHLFLREQLLAKVQSLILMKRSSDEALDSQIRLLQAQIQPHFLYNALNVITQLCIENPQKAHDVLLDFSQYLRGKFGFRTLDRPISINQEVLTIRSYLNVEKARFGSRLDYEIVVTGSGERAIPPLIIQPLVENAVKHGVSGIQSGGKVNVTIVEETFGTTVQVTDNGIGMSRSTLNAIVSNDQNKLGTGIINVNKRLKLYGSSGLMVESTIEKGTTIYFNIPLRWENSGRERL